ncbi:hypothetical protein [Streptomyces sp. NPDC087512]|uniref:hypothetical protein n=1 Tax=unclassified Streptomyces TaxID=2593676 RepID=UPI00343486A6
MHRHGQDVRLGVAPPTTTWSFLEAVIAEPESALDDRQWVEWRDRPAHEFGRT